MRDRARARAESSTTAELEFSRLLENAQDLIYRHRVTPPQGIEYINSACLAITGHTPEEFYADPNLVLTAVHPDDRPLLLEAFQDDPKLRPVLLLRWIHPDGRVVWA